VLFILTLADRERLLVSSYSAADEFHMGAGPEAGCGEVVKCLQRSGGVEVTVGWDPRAGYSLLSLHLFDVRFQRREDFEELFS